MLTTRIFCNRIQLTKLKRESNMKLKNIVVILLSISLTACATRIRPVVDTKGIDMHLYSQDLKECQAYAQASDPASNAVAGAIIGGLIGLAIGKASGAGITNEAGKVGAVSGAFSGAGEGYKNKKSIVASCLSGRGYHVLN
jgi:outer membrane lipoprotein SlyB